MLPTDKSKAFWERESDVIVKAMQSGKSFFLTGPAGTGKSALVKEIKAKLDRRAVLTSTTGISAMNIGGTTIHSFSGIGIHNDPRAVDTISRSINWPNIRSRIQATEVVIIDEISMMRSDTLTLIDRVFQRANDNRAPFGGKSILLSGDFLQLPPVPKHDDPPTGRWAFDSSSWKEISPRVIRLNKIHRQHDRTFLTHLGRVRIGECPDDTDRFFSELSTVDDSKNCLRFFPTNREADAHNQNCLNKIETKSFHYTASVWGLNSGLEGQIRSSCNAIEHLELKIGARVIILVNDKESSRFANGSMGILVGFSEKNFPIVEIDGTGAVITFESNRWELLDYRGKVLAEFDQIPLRLAYGITIHKSQGLTLDEATIDCRRIFAPGQAYVALSRVRTSKALRLNGWNRARILVDEQALAFNRSLETKGV